MNDVVASLIIVYTRQLLAYVNIDSCIHVREVVASLIIVDTPHPLPIHQATYSFFLFYLPCVQAVLAVLHAVLQASHGIYKFASVCGYAKFRCKWVFIAGRRAGD